MSKEAMKLARENFATAKELCDKHSKLDRRIVYGNALITHFDAVCQALALVNEVDQEQPAQQNAVAWEADRGEIYYDKEDAFRYSDGFIRPLVYGDTPQAQRTWVGLTDEQYFEIGQRHWLPSIKVEKIHKEIIEAAHGIKEQT